MKHLATLEQGWKVCELTEPDWKHFQNCGRESLSACAETGMFTKQELSWDRSFLSSCDLGMKFSCVYFALEGDGMMVTTQSHYEGKTKQGAWGRYLTFHFAYPLLGLRKLGY